jgi:hypothetical protein
MPDPCEHVQIGNVLSMLRAVQSTSGNQVLALSTGVLAGSAPTKEHDMRNRNEALLGCMGRVAERERTRVVAEFEKAAGREYDGGSDADWDAIDKDFAGIEEAMNVVRAAGM